MNIEKKFYTVKEFCEVTRMSRSTFSRLLKSGKIKIARTSDAPKAKILIPIEEVNKLIVSDN